MDSLFSPADIERLKAHGLDPVRVRRQFDQLTAGVEPVGLNRPCALGDGIFSIPEHDYPDLIRAHEAAMADGRIMQFVPASGAASRMFQDWQRYLDEGFETPAAAREFDTRIVEFAFFPDLKRLIAERGGSFDEWLAQGRRREILAALLTPEGLNYSGLPKALLKFHRYPEGGRTALEEHLVEAAQLVKDRDGFCRIHFTVSAEHRSLVEETLASVKGRYEEQYQLRLEVAVSVQAATTDMPAVDAQNSPLRDDAGGLILRPGGHGALLPNLNQVVAGDVVFLKNIDNVVPDPLKPTVILHKKLLAGYLIRLQEEIFSWLRRLDAGSVAQEDMERLILFCRERLHLHFPASFSALSPPEKKNWILARLNRPLRVCGMVRNEGEPGGAPFWVDDKEGTTSLQIVEEAQIDGNSEAQRRLWSGATHFNPVDLVCGLRDHRGRKHDLRRFVDPQAGLVVQKTERGRRIKALEWPGLWNGSMARWTSVFVEVPRATFNPVKSVCDLLKPAHLFP